MFSPDEIQHVRTKSEVSAERLLKGRKHFSQSVMVSVAVSKLGKTDLVFMQPGTKINSAYYCENVLEQGLLPAICRILNNDFVFQQDGVPAYRSHHTVANLRSSMLGLLKQKTGRQTVQINPADYSVWRALQQMVYSHKISDTDQLSKF